MGAKDRVFIGVEQALEARYGTIPVCKKVYYYFTYKNPLEADLSDLEKSYGVNAEDVRNKIVALLAKKQEYPIGYFTQRVIQAISC